VQIWGLGDRYDAVVPVPAAVTGARLWPVPTVPDWNAANDAWGDAPPAPPPAPATQPAAARATERAGH
jgi:hypothetical protein